MNNNKKSNTKDNEWRKFFPFKEPRQDQIDALNQIIPALKQGKKYILLQLGTGVGKSAIAVTVCGWAAENLSKNEKTRNRGGVILTSQKILQDQYNLDFDKAADLRSASNYECLWAKGSTCGEIMRVASSCSGWPCNQSGCIPISITGEKYTIDDSKCPYAIKRKKFWCNPIGITNYSYMLSAIVHGMGSMIDDTKFKQQVFVLDECHKFEEEIRKWSSIFVDLDLCDALSMSFPDVQKLSDKEVLNWAITSYKLSLEQKIINLETTIKASKERFKNNEESQYNFLKPIMKLHERLDMKKCQLTRCSADIRGTDNYVVDRNFDKKGKIASFEIKPISVTKSMHDIVYNFADHVIFMSATILDKKEFCMAHGIPQNETVYIDIDSPFDPKAFGITYWPVASMNKGKIDESIPKIIKVIKQILKDHPNEKGIIHTSNNKVALAIHEKIKNKRLLVQLDTGSRNRILDEHINSKEPTVLVSPSMMEGLDLKDSLGRFQIICKVPFPFLGDSVVKKIMEKNQKWYSWRTALVLIQSVGRCVRNDQDWAKTYILDECFGKFFVRWIKFFPKSFSAMEVKN